MIKIVYTFLLIFKTCFKVNFFLSFIKIKAKKLGLLKRIVSSIINRTEQKIYRNTVLKKDLKV